MSKLQERRPTRVQIVVLRKEQFPTERQARTWAREHGFRTDRIDETQFTFRFKQFPPKSYCVDRSLRSTKLDTGVSGLIGPPRWKEAVERERPAQTSLFELPVDKLTRLEAMIDDYQVDLCTMALDVPSLELRTVGGESTLNAGTRRDMLMALRQGEVVELTLDAVTFRQHKDLPRPLPFKLRKHANGNFIRFRDKDLPRLAKTFKNKPFLRDHDRRDLLKRGGTIVDSELRESGSHMELAQRIHLIKPWAVESALDGTLQTFSIGWDASAPGPQGLRNAMHCTVCDNRLFSMDCPHMPGEVAKVAKSDESVIVEAEFREPLGAETSAVAFPAVQGTNVESIAPTS